MEFNIPLEIKDKAAFPQLKKNDRLTVAYAVLFGVGNQEAFKTYHPEYLTANGQLNDAGKKANTMFWNYGKVKDYRQAYEEELVEFLGRSTHRQTSEAVADIDEGRKDKALKSLLNQAMNLVEGTGDLDAETLKIAAEIFKKVGLLKDEETQIEPARRYLPIRCLSECAYRHFVESHVESGDIISECDYCRTRKFAEEHGWRYDPTKNLDLPIKESKNE